MHCVHLRMNKHVMKLVGFVLMFVLLLSIYRLHVKSTGKCQGLTKFEPNDDYIADYFADDWRLVQHIRRFYLEPPVDRRVPYLLNDPHAVDYSQLNQSAVVASFFNHKRNGFFVEAGAYDGEEFSNSLYFEKELNWTGLLIEPDDESYEQLSRKQRKAWRLKACLCGSHKPCKMKMYRTGDSWSLSEYTLWFRMIGLRLSDHISVTDVWCFPLLSVLLAINRTDIDYLALSMEGAEIPVLRSIITDKLNITVVQVEVLSFLDVS
ncbi:unnamed protein product, partial [Soboliphyme baturini]|uniref:Methyltransf_21 domain-containing protein n=1 Tax=Soboliphyme baturini TaxID=241478 RepID=A0A183J3Y1_9BILA